MCTFFGWSSHRYLCHASLKINKFWFSRMRDLHCTGFMHAEQIFNGESKLYCVLPKLKS